MTTPLVVTYHTPEYGEHAHRMLRSAQAHGYAQIVVHAKPSRGSWLANCAQKAEVVLDHLRAAHRTPVLWVDADAEFRAPWPEDAVPPGADVAAYCPGTPPWAPWWSGPRRHPLCNSSLLSGTLWFAPTLAAIGAAEAWAEACRARGAAEYDQELLFKVLRRAAHGRLHNLDPRFVCVPDLMPDVRDPVIVHHQASRTMKDAIR